MKRPSFPEAPLDASAHAVLARVSPGCPPHRDRLLTCSSPVRHSTHSRRSGLVRLACVKHAASVRPEPGSNSPLRKSNSALNEHFSFSKKCSESLLCVPKVRGEVVLPARATRTLQPRLSISVSSDLLDEPLRLTHPAAFVNCRRCFQLVRFGVADRGVRAGAMRPEGIEPSTLGLRVPCSAS